MSMRARFRPNYDLTEDQCKDIEMVRQEFTFIANNMADLLPPGRRANIVQTHLEEAALMAVKAITHAGVDK